MLKKIIWRQAYNIASVAFVLLTIMYFVAIINHPYVGLDLNNHNGKWIVADSDPYGEGYKLGVRVGDIILRINNQETGDYHFVQKWGETEGASVIEFQKSTESTDYIIKIPKRPSKLMVFSEIPMAILGLVFMFFGYFTWFKRPYMIQARALFWANWFIGLAIILTPASSRVLMFSRDLESIVMSLVPLTLVDLFSVFPSENRNRINWVGRNILAVTSVLIIALTVLQSAGILHINSSIKKLILTNLLVGILLVLMNLWLSIRTSNDTSEKNQVNIVLLGIALAFLPFIILTAIPVILNTQPIVNTEISYLFVSAFPITLSYVIVNKYLLDCHQLLEYTLIFLIEGVITSIVVTFVLFFVNVFGNLNIEKFLAVLPLTLAFMVYITFLRITIKKIINTYLFPEGKHAFKKRILDLNERLISIHEEESILEEFVNSLKIQGAFIIIKDDKSRNFNKSVGMFAENINERYKLQEYFRTEQKINLEAKLLSDDSQAEVYIPVISDNYICGIFLGHRYSKIKFKKEDLAFITLISSQLAQRLTSALVTKELSNEIKDLANQTFKLQRKTQGLHGITAVLFRNFERERKSIAHEIHDGPLQFVLDLDRRLKKLTKDVSAKDEMVEDVLYMRELVEELSMELRLICKGLRPPTLSDLGLLSATELMCEEIMLNEPILISLEIVGINREDRFDEEVEIAAYRFLQEGISNAVKHSNSNELKVHLEMKESKIELIVKDSGKGFDTNKIDDWLMTGVHYGIAGMKERLESLGGNLQISSSNGRGTMLKAIIPSS
ncbi:ATP-binding protein [Desulfosporosinus sp. PR]|uniref:ATP-binding protein n=1 Tax=Candidatus Desulfosporosinus nitrosoreducens TaxID=3401928 RepID=UPI0027EC1FEB|nr:ATP-binding protein [Desulfosporosinus sp. PR]MDQ7096588.1 ATP-binding protein [Desulfosporosinus sp. PR]